MHLVQPNPLFLTAKQSIASSKAKIITDLRAVLSGVRLHICVFTWYVIA